MNNIRALRGQVIIDDTCYYGIPYEVTDVLIELIGENTSLEQENKNLKQALNEIKKYCKKISNLYWGVDDEPKYVQKDILEIIDKYMKEDD